MKKGSSLKRKILLNAFLIIFLSFSILVIFVELQAEKMVKNEIFKRAEEIAKTESEKIQLFLERGMSGARVLAHSFEGLKRENITDRDILNAQLKQVLTKNNSFLGVWTCWEPNALVQPQISIKL